MTWVDDIKLKISERLDTKQTAIMERALEAVKSQTYDIKYPSLKARALIPMSTEVDPGATAIIYQQYDEYGAAKLIASYADDLPLVDIAGEEFTSPVKGVGAAYSFSIQEMRSAAMAGVPLSSRKARAARRAIELAIDNIAFEGNVKANLTGFANNVNVPVTTAANPGSGTTWAVKTPEQILADLHENVKDIVTTTLETHTPDTVVLPTDQYARIAQTHMSADNSITVLKAFLEQNPYINTVESWYKLATADAAGTGPRMITYLKDPEVLTLEIPQDFEQFPPEVRNLSTLINCHARIGGCIIYYPMAIQYMDGI